MFRNNVTENNIPSLVINHTNQNRAHTNQINHDYITYDNEAEVEMVKINSRAYYEESDSDEHESCLNDASNFINEARRKKITRNEDNRKPSYIDPLNRCGRSFCTSYRSNVMDTSIYERAKEERKQIRNHFFNTINDFLEELENSSDDERPIKIKQNNFDDKDAQYDSVHVFDQSVYVQEVPMLLYSFKNKNCVLEGDDNLINSPHKSPNTSLDSNSVKTFNEGTYEKNFFRIPKSFPPVIIPRLPLAYMLPTVTEILEPSRQSPKITEIYEEVVNVTRKPINSWVMHADNSSNSEGNDTIETNMEHSANESSLNNTKESLHLQDNSVIVHYKNDIMEYDNENDETKNNDNTINQDLSCKSLHLQDNSVIVHYKNNTMEYDNENDEIKNSDNTINQEQSHLYFEREMENPSPKSTLRSKRNVFVNTYIIDNSKQQNSSDSFNKIKSVRKEIFGNYSIKSRDRNSTPNTTRDFSSVNSIPALHLSLNREIDTTEQSWFKRFIKCILCCK